MALSYGPCAFSGLAGRQRFPLDSLCWSFLVLEILLHLNHSKYF